MQGTNALEKAAALDEAIAWHSPGTQLVDCVRCPLVQHPQCLIHEQVIPFWLTEEVQSQATDLHLGPLGPEESTGPRAVSCKHPSPFSCKLPNFPVPYSQRPQGLTIAAQGCNQGCNPACTARERLEPLLSFPIFPWAWERAGFLSNYPISFLAFPRLASLSYLIFYADFPKFVFPFMVSILVSVPPSLSKRT